MKNTARVPAHTSPARPALQPKTNSRAAKAKSPKAFRLPKDALHHACLVIFDRENQEPAQRIPLSESEFLSLMNLGIISKLSQGKSVSEMVADAVRKAYLASSATTN